MSARQALEHLPLEVLERIATFLCVSDLSKCCAVSKSWHQLFSDDTFWKSRVDKLTDYFTNASSLVKPQFIPPQVKNSTLPPVQGWRLNVLREQHLWKNWKLGRFVREEIEFDFDDSICYNIKVESVANDYIFLHFTFETQVFDVSGKPESIFTVPFGLVEMWEKNLYKVVGNKLIVIQCNVVQIFNIDFIARCYTFDKAFFINKPQEFSCAITNETDLQEMFQEDDIGDDIERVICGDLLVGIVTERSSHPQPQMHIWNWRKGEKLKVEDCSKYFNSSQNMFIETSETPDCKNIVVLNQNGGVRQFVVYSLETFQVLASDEVENRDSLLFGKYLAIFNGSEVKFAQLTSEAVINPSKDKFEINRIDCWHAINNKVLIVNKTDLVLVNPSNATVEFKAQLDFVVGSFQVVQNRLVIFHDKEENFREVWEAGKELKKLFCFPPNGEICRSVNSAFSKVILEKCNKLIILNFW